MKLPGWAKRGGAVAALPLLLWLAPPLWCDKASDEAVAAVPDAPNLDADAMYLVGRPEALNDAPRGLGFPTTGSQLPLYGGGASFSKGALRVAVQTFVGGLSATDGDLDTEWRIRFGNVILEQRYPTSQFLFTAGGIFTYGQVEGILTDTSTNGITRYDGTTWGFGTVAGVRWPAQTRLGFLARTGYLWLPVTGEWKGEYASTKPTSSFDLGGPIAQLQVELSF